MNDLSKGKIRIKISQLGYLPFEFKISKFRDWQSSIWEVFGQVEKFKISKNSDLDNWEFSDELLSEFVKHTSDVHIHLAITNVPLKQNYYIRRLSNNRIILSFHGMRQLLEHLNLPLENLILRTLYAYSFIYLRHKNSVPTNAERTNFTHEESRGCVFDLNNIRENIEFSLHEPVICEECVEKLKSEGVKAILVERAQEEMKEIKKDHFFILQDQIKKSPFATIFISVFISVILSLAASFIYDSVK